MQFSQTFFHSTPIRSFRFHILRKLYHSIAKSVIFLNSAYIKKLNKFEIDLNVAKRLDV